MKQCNDLLPVELCYVHTIEACEQIVSFVEAMQSRNESYSQNC